MLKNPYSYALKKLSRKAYSQESLKRLLLSKGVCDEEIRDILAKLTYSGYLNDRRLGESIVYHYTNIKPRGRKYVFMKLAEKGVPSEMYSSLMEEYLPEKERELAVVLITKNFGDNLTQIPSQKIARYLQNRGFTNETIYRIIRGS